MEQLYYIYVSVTQWELNPNRPFKLHKRDIR